MHKFIRNAVTLGMTGFVQSTRFRD